LQTTDAKSFITLVPDVLIFFVVAYPLNNSDQFDNETQWRLDTEFEMYGDILQVHEVLYMGRV
jgi:hypothetical protein